MLLANQRLPDGNQIFNVPFAEINCREIFKYVHVHVRGRFLKKKLFFFFCDEVLLAGAALPLFNS